MSYSDLNTHWDSIAGQTLSDLALDRKSREFVLSGWTANLSRQFLDEKAEALLLALSKSSEIESAISSMFAAEHINPSEDRPAMHWAMRGLKGAEGIAEQERATLDPALTLAQKIRAESKFKTILHLGIGGSDFGPRLLNDACSGLYESAFDLRFAANVDPLDLDRALEGLDASTTLVVGVSKSFSSEETMYNLERCKNWLQSELGEIWPDHVALVTSAPEKAINWMGRDNNQIMPMPVSVGGRYSLWSSVSFACIVTFGVEWFEELLSGGRDVDDHMQEAPLEDNLPLKFALLDYWNMTVRGIESNIILGYSNALRMLPTYLQQLELESNGKSIGPDGQPIPTKSIGALWGGEGTIGQHSYHQWIHQGTSNLAVEFVIALHKNKDELGNRKLVAHALAQAEVLANGRSESEVASEEPDLPEVIRKQKVMAGGKPSIILACKDFNARALGSLIALYEHRTFLAGRLWGVNSFDQWGVERGKTQAAKIQAALGGEGSVHDEITSGLVEFFTS